MSGYPVRRDGKVRQIGKRKALTTKTVKVLQQKMKALPEKPPFVTGIVHHRIGSPYKSEIGTTTVRSIKTHLTDKMNIQKRTRVFHSNATAKQHCEVWESRENAAIANGLISAPEITQTSSNMCEEVKVEKGPGKYKTYKRNQNVNPSPTFLPVANGEKLNAPVGGRTNNFVLEDKANYQEEKKAVNVASYREELDKVIIELESLCNEWLHLSIENSAAPEETVELVNVAIGQTKLLIKEKLGQYRGLIDECASSSGPRKVTEDDLRGFWDMLSIQICNVQSKFEHLATLKQNGWKESEEVKKATVPKRKTGTMQANIMRPPLKSSLRDHIAAMRKMKKAVEQENKKPSSERNQLV